MTLAAGALALVVIDAVAVPSVHADTCSTVVGGLPVTGLCPQPSATPLATLLAGANPLATTTPIVTITSTPAPVLTAVPLPVIGLPAGVPTLPVGTAPQPPPQQQSPGQQSPGQEGPGQPNPGTGATPGYPGGWPGGGSPMAGANMVGANPAAAGGTGTPTVGTVDATGAGVRGVGAGRRAPRSTVARPHGSPNAVLDAPTSTGNQMRQYNGLTPAVAMVGLTLTGVVLAAMVAAGYLTGRRRGALARGTFER